MKKLLFGVIALGMLAACNTTEETANLTEDTNARKEKHHLNCD